MANVLVLNQKIDNRWLSVVMDALPTGARATVITGSDVDVRDGVTFVRTVPHDPRSLASRLNCWVGFAWAVIRWRRRNPDAPVDLIVAASNPPINSLIGLWLKRETGSPFVYMNWDVYPQVIEQSIRNPIVKVACRAWHALNSWNYPRIDRMLTVGVKMAESINEPLRRKVDIGVVPMYADTDTMIPREKERNPFAITHELVNRFVVIYSGKMGLGHKIPLLLAAAKVLRSNRDIVFLFVGHGPGYQIVRESILSGAADNVRLLPLQSEELFPYSMASGDVGIVAEEERLARLIFPCKTYDMMACGMPVIALCTFGDDLYGTVTRFDIGRCVIDGSADSVAEAVAEMYCDVEARLAMGRRARDVAVAEYSMRMAVERYSKAFSGALGEGARGPSARSKSNEELLAEIKEIHAESDGT